MAVIQKLHHIGYVVPALDAVVEEFRRAFGLEWDGKIFHDPLQMARVTFLSSVGLGTALIELVEAVGKRSPVRKFSDEGGGLHHVCYEVDDLAAQLTASQENGGMLVRVPMPAVAFDGRRVAWIRTAQSVLVEYLQR